MSEPFHDLFVIQHKISAEKTVWMFGMKARTLVEGILIYSDEQKLVTPTEMQWSFGHERLIIFKECISTMSAENAKHIIDLIKTVRASRNETWMHHVIVALRVVGIIDLDTSRKWTNTFKHHDLVAEGPVVTLPCPVGQSMATTTATDQAIPSQSTASQPAANTTAAAQPTAPPSTAGIAAVHQSASDKSMPDKPTGRTVPSGKSTAGQFMAPQPRAAQPELDPPKASQSSADQSVAPKLVARQSPAGPLAAAVSAAEAVKSRTSSTTKVQMPPIPESSKGPGKSPSPGGSGGSPRNPRSSMASRPRRGTSPAATSGKKTESPQRKV